MSREGLLVQTLVQLADNLVDDFDVIDVLTTLSDRCVDILDVSAAGVMLVDQGGELQVVASSSEAMRILELFELQASQGPCVDCYHSGELVVSEDLSASDGRWPTFTPRAVDAGFQSVHALPMRLRGRTVGALNLFRAQTGILHEIDVVSAQALADVATIAIVQNQNGLGPQLINAQLSQALYSRIIIEQAKGVISEAAGLDMDHAFRQLRHYAQTHQIGLADLSLDIADGSMDPRLLDPSRPAPHDAAPAAESDDLTSSRTVTVCLVEDNANLREQLRRFLTDAGVDVLAAVGSIYAGAAAVTRHRPDVAIIDQHLPDGTGIQLIRTLAHSAPHVSLLLYSATAADDDVRNALQAGAAGVIAKSVRADGLLEAVFNSRHSQQR